MTNMKFATWMVLSVFVLFPLLFLVPGFSIALAMGSFTPIMWIRCLAILGLVVEWGVFLLGAILLDKLT